MDAADQQLIEEETAADPAFGARIAATLALPNGPAVVAASAKRAVANEFNPSVYPETAGMWMKLRGAVRSTVNSVSSQMTRPAVQKATLKGLGNLGQDDIGSILGPIISAVAGAAGAVASAEVTASAQRQIASETLSANEAMIQAQEAEAASQAAIVNAQAAETGAPGANVSAVVASTAPVAAAVSSVVSGVQSVVSTLSQPVGTTGVPVWALLLGAVVLAKAL